MGAIACLVLAVVEFGAWALVLPRDRSIKEDDVPSLGSGDRRATNAASNGSRFRRPTGRGCRPAGSQRLEQRATGRTVLLLHGFAEASTALGGTTRGGLEPARLERRSARFAGLRPERGTLRDLRWTRGGRHPGLA